MKKMGSLSTSDIEISALQVTPLKPALTLFASFRALEWVELEDPQF